MSHALFDNISYLVTRCDEEKFGKKLLRENDVEAVLERLDRLTREEAQTTATQTLKLVYGLVKNIKIVLDGARCFLLVVRAALIVVFLSRRKRLDGECPSISRCVLLIGWSFVINSSVSTHPAAHE